MVILQIMMGGIVFLAREQEMIFISEIKILRLNGGLFGIRGNFVQINS